MNRIGLIGEYAPKLEQVGLCIAGVDGAGEVRTEKEYIMDRAILIMEITL